MAGDRFGSKNRPPRPWRGFKAVVPWFFSASRTNIGVAKLKEQTVLKRFMSIAFLSLALCLFGCGSTDATPACQLLEDYGDCPACYDGMVTCSYADITVTVGSCQGCQARVQVYIQLCNNGNTDSAEDIEAGTECTEPVQE